MSWRYDMPLITSVAALLLSMSSSHSCDCGAFVHTLHRTNHRYQFGTAQRGTFSRLSSSNNNEGDYGSFSDDDREGRLAAQFYDQLKKRKLTSASSQNENIISVDDLYTVDSNKNDQRPPVRKFTGASPSSLFSNEPTTSPSNNLQREREREYNLAGRFERTFGIQVAILLLSLVGVISVGLSGGITDGSDRNFGYDDMLDDIFVERFRSDDAAEVEAMHQSSSAVKSVMQIEDSAAGSIQSKTQESYWL